MSFDDTLSASMKPEAIAGLFKPMTDAFVDKFAPPATQQQWANTAATVTETAAEILKVLTHAVASALKGAMGDDAAKELGIKADALDELCDSIEDMTSQRAANSSKKSAKKNDQQLIDFIDNFASSSSSLAAANTQSAAENLAKGKV